MAPLSDNLQFEESLISAKMEQLAEDDDEEGGAKDGEEEGTGEDFLLTDDAKDIDLRCGWRGI
jgi:pre-mRNA-splicing factor SYF1